jgi:DnaJ-class molecular chaperone
MECKICSGTGAVKGKRCSVCDGWGRELESDHAHLSPQNIRTAAYALCRAMRQPCRNFPNGGDLAELIRQGREMEENLREALADAEVALTKPDPV